MPAGSTTSGRHLARQCAGMRGGLSCCPSLFCLVHSEFMNPYDQIRFWNKPFRLDLTQPFSVFIWAMPDGLKINCGWK